MKPTHVATHILWWLPETAWEGDTGPGWALDPIDEFGPVSRLPGEADRCPEPIDADIHALTRWTADTLGHPVTLRLFSEDGTVYGVFPGEAASADCASASCEAGDSAEPTHAVAWFPAPFWSPPQAGWGLFTADQFEQTNADVPAAQCDFPRGVDLEPLTQWVSACLRWPVTLTRGEQEIRRRGTTEWEKAPFCWVTPVGAGSVLADEAEAFLKAAN